MSGMTPEEWRQYAGNRGRVVNTATGQTGNLHEVFRGYATVFIRYTRVGTVKLPDFEKWPLEICQKEEP